MLTLEKLKLIKAVNQTKQLTTFSLWP